MIGSIEEVHDILREGAKTLSLTSASGRKRYQAAETALQKALECPNISQPIFMEKLPTDDEITDATERLFLYKGACRAVVGECLGLACKRDSMEEGESEDDDVEV